jgi:putative transposase
MIPRRDRFEMIDKKGGRLSLRKQCELLCIPRTNFYYKPNPESQVNLHIMRLMDEQYLKTPFYGFPRMFDYVKDACPLWILNPKRVYRLYKKMGLKSLPPGPHTSRPAPTPTYKFPYLLKNIQIERVNQVWASDITYIPMRAGYMFLYAIIDVYSRYILNWGLSNNMTAQWCTTLTREALYKWGNPEIFNTDQGSQFTSDSFVDLLQEHKTKISMDGKGRAIDNIFIERFWRTIKYEYIYINPANGGHELYSGIEEYMQFYNYERNHESIGKMTPAKRYGAKNNSLILTKYSTINSSILV